MANCNYGNIGNYEEVFAFSSFPSRNHQSSFSLTRESQYSENPSNNLASSQMNGRENFDDIIDKVAKWFLNKTSMSNKKLQKLCYYAYCWFIVWFNDIEDIQQNKGTGIQTFWMEHFQAWIHGPVLPSLYSRYKQYGWHDIPRVEQKPVFTEDIEKLLEEVWEAYSDFCADELESISHQEFPWRNARKNLGSCEACCNRISEIDILEYYSGLE